jgi:predicted DNA-binding transcriptional regulator YafY
MGGMIQTSARLLRLLALFQAQRYWPGTALASHLEITPRTLRRDVDRLRSLGYPVHSTSGLAGGYQLGAGAHLPPLLLDDEEAVAVALGLRTSASAGVSGVEEASVRALLKLEQVLPPRLRHRVTALHGFIVPVGNRRPTISAELLSSIAAACRDHDSIRFQYNDRAGAASARNVEPHRLVHTGYRWYLVAWDLFRNDWRIFRLDRIEGRPKLSTRFKPRKPPGGDFAAFASKSLANVPYRHRARVTLNAPLVSIAKRVPPSAGVLEEIDAHSCLLHAGSDSLESLAIHLLWLGVDFQVHEPAEFAIFLQRTAERFTRAIAVGIHSAQPQSGGK